MPHRVLVKVHQIRETNQMLTVANGVRPVGRGHRTSPVIPCPTADIRIRTEEDVTAKRRTEDSAGRLVRFQPSTNGAHGRKLGRDRMAKHQLDPTALR